MPIIYSNKEQVADILKQEIRLIKVPRRNKHGMLIGNDEVECEGQLSVEPKCKLKNSKPWFYAVCCGKDVNGKKEYWIRGDDREVTGLYSTIRLYLSHPDSAKHKSVAILGAGGLNVHPFFQHLKGPRDTYDIEPLLWEWAQTRQPHVCSYWNFIEGDYKETIGKKKYDVLFYDVDEAVHFQDWIPHLKDGGILLQMDGFIMTKQELIDWEPPVGPT